jgi:hypothetical protein
MNTGSLAIKFWRVVLTCITLLFAQTSAFAYDNFDGTTGVITAPVVKVNTTFYWNVAFTLKSLVSVGQAPATSNYDTFNAANNQLTIASVMVDGVEYFNVVVVIDKVLSVEGEMQPNAAMVAASTVAAYDSNTGFVSLPVLQVGTTTYNNATVGVGSVVSVGPVNAALITNSLDTANNQVTIPLIIVGAHAYNNVVIALGNVTCTAAQVLTNGVCVTPVVMISSTRTGIAANSNYVEPICNDGKISDLSDATLFARIDRAKLAGYSGLTIDYNVMVDESGAIVPETTPRYTDERMWQLVAYAKSIGMNANLKVHWSGPDNECGNLNDFNTPAGFNMDTYFATVKAHFVKIAPRAQAAGVNEMYLGTENNAYVIAKYHDKWADIVQTIRASFSGTITFDGTYMGTDWGQGFFDIAIWDLVDKIGISFYPVLSATPLTLPEAIKTFSYRTDVSTGNQWGGTRVSVIDDMKAVSVKYGKKIILGEVNFNASTESLRNYVPINAAWAATHPVDQSQRVIAYTALFTVLNTELKDVVTGVNIWGSPVEILTPSRPEEYKIQSRYEELFDTVTEVAIKPFITCNKSVC